MNDVSLANANIVKFRKKFPATQVLAPGLEQHLKDATNVINVSAFLFEKHRISSLKTLLINLVHTELQYHVNAIENLSPLLESLHQIPDEFPAENEESVHYEDDRSSDMSMLDQ